MKDKKSNVRNLTELALLVAIILVMKVTGLTSIPVGLCLVLFHRNCINAVVSSVMNCHSVLTGLERQARS